MVKSGIKMIEELADAVALLGKRFEVIEQNTKILLKRANGSQIKAQGAALTGLKPTTTAAKTKQSSVTASKVMGKIKNQEGKAVSGVKVKIFNEHSHIIKETKTNRAGDWMCFLPPGKYGAEYFLKDMINANVNFIVTSEQRLIRVAQPQGG